ncbi:MAG: CopG family transcriptional regulator [Actinomycetota bacterium]|nr:ribbon-helix-helix domain-containing protein [Actinomycetota bacterium]
MARTQTLVQLTEEIVALLDAEASRRNVSRSEVVREAVTKYFAESERAEIDRRIVEGYKRIPPGTPDEWADLEAQTDAETTDLLRRLDAEERDADKKPW